MSLAICIDCGHTKSKPPIKCSHCGFSPRTDIELAKSLILSLNYEIEGRYMGQSKDRLLEIGALAQRGQKYKFDSMEVDRVVQYAHGVLAAPRSVLLRNLIKWLLLPALVVAIMLVVLFLKP